MNRIRFRIVAVIFSLCVLPIMQGCDSGKKEIADLNEDVETLRSQAKEKDAQLIAKVTELRKLEKEFRKVKAEAARSARDMKSLSDATAAEQKKAAAERKKLKSLAEAAVAEQKRLKGLSAAAVAKQDRLSKSIVRLTGELKKIMREKVALSRKITALKSKYESSPPKSPKPGG